MDAMDIDVTQAGNGLAFDHVHMYVDALADMDEYKRLEARFNLFDAEYDAAGGNDLATGKELFERISGETVDASKYVSHGRDLVCQFIGGAGWRVTGSHDGTETRSVVVTSPNLDGAKFVLTAPQAASEGGAVPAAKRAKVAAHKYDHFAQAHLTRFSTCQAGRQGVAALCFSSPDVTTIAAAYNAKHPALCVADVHDYTADNGATCKIFEVFAYYDAKSPKEADRGTVLRFIERSTAWGSVALPGCKPVAALFPKRTETTYSDHWVSNVVDRKQFLLTLEDTLGFSPKVDFNAGIVAAGEAIIESTVTGNNPGVVATSPDESLRNQQQIYLPINNALSEVGHVHLYLEEIGQGIQHIACRVKDLPTFIQRVNEHREMTGEGFTFLNIPRSYYGIFSATDLMKIEGMGQDTANAAVEALTSAGLVDKMGAVSLDVKDGEIESALAGMAGVAAHKAAIVASCKRGRYNNMYALLGDSLSEEQFIQIVRNKVLVDLQAGDILFQIFTSCVTQREPGTEAPFLEFIQRVCGGAKKGMADGIPAPIRPIRPGCGGFGIRNFLTLFLSIEVSKAMKAMADAAEKGNTKLAELSRKQVETLTQQLDVSNPVLTDIAEAMTAEADALAAGDAAKAEEEHKKKLDGNTRLKEISDEYKGKMAAIREEITALQHGAE
jgi:hypothetical protein